MSSTLIEITTEETTCLMQAMFAHMGELRRQIESSQGYLNSLAGKTDELHLKYRESSSRHLASLREDLAAMESLWWKLMGGRA